MFPKNQNPGCEPELIRIFSNLAFGNQARWLLILSFFFLNGRLILQAQDTTPPSATISGSGTHSNSANFDFNIVFSEAVNGFVQSDLTISNGTIVSLGAGVTTYTHALTLGTTGMAGATNSLLDGPTSIAVDANGNILVVDRTNHRIQVYNSSGVYQSTIGTASAVADNTGFNSPWGIALDSQGNLYVSDQANHRVQIFNSSYVYQSTIGTGAIVSDNTGFNNPSDIHVDASGNIYVSDRGNHRVQIFDNTQTYVATIGTGAAVSDNTGFNAPHGLTTDASGNLYVTDRSNGRVQVFGPGPTYTYSNTISGLVFPLGVDIDGNGNLYIAEALTHRLRVFDNTLSLLGSVVTGTSSGSTNTDLNTPSDVTVDVNGRIYVADSGNERVQVFTTTETYTASVTATSEGLVTLTLPAMVATDGAGNQNTTAEGSFTYDTTAPTPSINTTFGNFTNTSPFEVNIDFGESMNDFFLPDITVGNGFVNSLIPPVTGFSLDRTISATAVVGFFNELKVGPDGNLYISDTNNSLIQVLSPTGSLVRSFGGPNLDSPGEIDFDANGNVYVTDDGNTEVYVFDQAGTQLSSFASNELNNPIGIGIAPNGNIYVLDDDPQILVYNSALNFVESFASNTLSNPRDLLIDTNGNILVLDDGNNAIYTFDSSHNLNSTLTINDAGSGSYQDFVLNSQGQFNITDTEPKISVYETSGLVTTFGATDFTMGDLRGASFDSQGDLHIGDRVANALRVFSPPNTAYAATITANAEGPVTLDVAANVAADLAGNQNNAATQSIITYDQTPPSISLSSTETNPTTATFFTLTIQFSEDVTGFDLTDLTIVNASTSNFAPTSASTYTVLLTPDNDGTITADVAAGAATDLSGNDNTAATQFSIVSDRAIPSVEILSSSASSFNSNPNQLIINFSEEISGFDLSDLTITNGTVANLTLMNNSYLVKNTIGTTIGDGHTVFNSPESIEVDMAGNIYIAERSNHRVQIFDSNQNFIATIGTAGQTQTDNTGFNFPNGVAVDANGNIYVSDQGNHRVQVFDANRNYVATLGTSGQSQTDNSGLSEPAEVEVDASGNIYVVDEANHRIQVFDSNRNYLTTMGTSGMASQSNSGFSFPEDVKIDQNGNIYVAERQNHRVQIFDSNRTYLATIGITGSQRADNTGLSNPEGVAIDNQGNIYIADTGNNRVQVYNAQRNYVATIGTTGQAQTDNTGFGHNSPKDLGIAANGDLLVVDRNNNRIQVYQHPMVTYTADLTATAEGAVTVMLPANAVNDTGGNGNTVSNTFSVIYDLTGPIPTFQGPTAVNNDDPITLTYVFNEPVEGFQISDIRSNITSGLNASLANLTEVNPSTYTLEVTPNGSQQNMRLFSFSQVLTDALGNTNNEFEVTIAYDHAGPVMDVQNEPSRVNTTNTFNITLEFNEDVTGFALEDLVVTNASLSNFAMVDADTYTVDMTPDGVGDMTIALQDASVTDALQNQNYSGLPTTILFDNAPPTATFTTAQNPTAQNTFDVMFQFTEPVTGFDQSVLQVSNGIINSLTSPTGLYNYLATIGTGFGTGNDQFRFTEDVTVDQTNGNIYVVDGSNHRIQVFDANRNYLATIGTGTSGSGNDQLSGPYGIAIDNQRRIFVADRSNHRVQVFDANRNYLATIGTGTSGNANDQLSSPEGVATDANGNIYVADSGNGRVQIFNSSFTYLTTMNNSANDVAIGPSGIIYLVLETDFALGFITGRVDGFDSNFNRLFTLGNSSLPGGEDDFNRPEKLAVASNGNVFVGDTRNNRIQVFDPFGNFVMTIGNGSGTGNDQFSRPHGLAFDANDNLYVNDQSNDRVQVWSAPDETHTANVTANGEGTVTVTVMAGAVTDAAGNASTTDQSLDIIVDQTSPTVTLTSDAGMVATAPFTVTAQFSEAVSGVALTDFTMSNATAGSFITVDQDTYTFIVSPSAEGNVTIDLAANTANDLAGNPNLVAPTLTVPYSLLAPGVTLSTTTMSPSTMQSFDVSVQFTEAVTGFDQSDITVSNGTVTNLTGMDASYIASITATNDGAVTVEVPAGVATDVVSENNTASNQVSITVDINAPTVSITSLTGSVINQNFDITIQFSEPITGFVSTDLVLTNSTISNFTAVDADTYTATVNNTTTGQVTIDVPAGVAQDAVGSNNVASTQFTRTYDPDAFNVQINPTSAGSFVNAPFDFNISPNRRTTPLQLSDLMVTNGTASNFVPRTTQSYSSTGAISTGGNNIDTPFGIVIDENTNVYVAGNNRVEVYNTSLQVINTLGDGTAGNNNSQFNNPRGITLDASGNLYVADRNNHRVQVFNSSLVYQATIGGTRGNGNTQLDFPTGVAVAPNGNIYVADQQNERVQVFDSNYNYVATIGSTDMSGNSNSQLSRPQDVFVDANGRIYIVDTNNDRVQVFSASLAYEGTIGTGSAGSDNASLNNPAGVFVDAFGDIYVADQTNHRVQVFDSNLNYSATLGTGSAGTGLAELSNPANVAVDILGQLIHITDQGNNRIARRTVNVSDASALITPANEGTVSLVINGGVINDGAGRSNAGSNIYELTYDITGPTVDIQNEPLVINNTAFTVAFEFNETITGFSLSDITTVNATASNFVTIDSDSYTALITPDGGGDITIDVAANVVTDQTGNGNSAATQAIVTYDVTPPDVSISSLVSVATNADFFATFTFTEPVTGFDISDITATNATLSNLTGAGNIYTVTVSPSAEGQVSLHVNAGIATDAAGNGNNAASQFSITYDITSPSVSLTHNIPSISSATLESVTAVFSETVSGFTITDIIVTNGTVPFFSGNLFQISPTAEGLVSFEVPAGVVADAAGNLNTASNLVSFTSDQTGPTISFMNVPIVVNAAGPFTITIEFNEAAGPVTVNDFQVTNGTATQVTGSGSAFTLEITPDGLGDITVQSLNGLTDAAGNAAINMVQETITLDITPPDVTITSAAGIATNFNPLRITLTFTEPVTGLDLADLVLTNATASNLLGSGTTFTVDLSPVAEGNMTVDLAANAVVDAANNGNNAAPQFTVTYDNTEPTVTLSTSTGTITNANPATVNLDFNENITGLELTDLMLTNATASNLAGSGASYTVDITPTAEGSVTVDLPALTVTDLAGNGNTLSNTVSFSYDMTAPTATISTMEASPTNQNSFLAQFFFSEDVTGFDMSDITIGNGTLSNFMGSGDAYSATITATADGAVLVDIASNAATDIAGNGNTAATQLAVIVDQTGPVITINAPATVGNNAFNVTFTFDEAVADFTLADVVVSNATTSNFMGSGTSYSLDLLPTSTNIITIDVAAGAATDALGNLSSAATQVQVTSDLTAPDLIISSTAGSPTNLTSIPVTFTFSENITGFDLADIAVSNASASNLTGSGMTYSIDITPIADGNITIDVAAGAATDEAGNGNNAAAQFSLVSDLTAPTVSISSSITGPTNASSIPVTITFSEDVTGFDITDLTAGNGSVSNFVATSGTVYTADLSPTADGTLTLDIAASAAADGAGNGNSAATQLSITSDQTAPTIVISSSLNSPTNAGTIPLTITFSEDVTGFNVSDFSVSNATAANFTATSASVYSVELSPTADGTITVDINAGIASDAGGNGNTAAAQFSITSDRTAPIITLSTTASDPTNLSSIPLTLTFSEDVSGFAIFDLVAGNASVNGFSMVSASSYLVNLAPTADGTVTLDIAGSVATDAAGNGNNAITQFSLVSDRTGPVVTILNAPALAGQTPFSLSFTFNEAVADFIESDISVANGTASNFSGSGTSYSADIAPDGNGDVTVSIATGAVTDGTGNTNATIVSETILTDFTAPSITISTPESSPSNASTFSATFTFSEMVTGFALGDITVVNGIASNLMASSATVYTADISPANDGDVAISVTAASAIDVVGNNNSASNTITITSDQTAPAVTAITRVDSNPLMGNMAQFAVSFSESVMGIESTDFSLIVTGNATGTVSNVSASTGNQVTVTVDNIGGGGTLGLNITDLTSMSDAAGNNLSAVAVSEAYDVNVAPTDITISNSSIQENNVVGDLIGSLSTIDADVNDQHTYSIVSGTGDTDNAAFTIDGANGLRAAVIFDFETQASYSLRIQTDDGRGGIFAKALTISITNEAEPEISITGVPLTFSATGPTPIGLSEQLSFQIVNNGDADLIINSITYPDAVFSGNFSSGTIAAQSSQTVTVTFAPTAPQTYSGNITIDADAGIELVSVSGLGAFVTDIPDFPDLDGKLNVYPNPANKMLTIDLKDLIQWEPKVSIFNSQGLMVFELKEFTDNRLSIDVSNYAQGIFLINIVTTKGIIQHKVMIKR